VCCPSISLQCHRVPVSLASALYVFIDAFHIFFGQFSNSSDVQVVPEVRIFSRLPVGLVMARSMKASRKRKPGRIYLIFWLCQSLALPIPFAVDFGLIEFKSMLTRHK